LHASDDNSASCFSCVVKNYSKTSKTYDAVRRPIALEIVREGFQRAAKAQGKKVSDLQVLDAGCGTGNYIHALAGGVKAMVGLDFNGGMLQQAQGKLGEGCDAVLLQGSIMDMPFVDNTFDAVVMNQVVMPTELSFLENLSFAANSSFHCFAHLAGLTSYRKPRNNPDMAKCDADTL